MRIAQVAPLYESVPPRLYGGTERVVSWLTERLVNLGHEVTLFASGDSVTNARLIPCCRQALRLDTTCIDPIVHHVLMVEKVFERADEFDLIHFHIDYLQFLGSRGLKIPFLTTLHGRLDIPDLAPLYTEFCDMPLVSISDAQRKPLPWANWLGTVQHGMPKSEFNPQLGDGKYLAFLGRISPEKGIDRAIEIAIRANMPFKIAAKVDRADREYFQSQIKQLLDHPLVEFIGEIGGAEKGEFLGNAAALLFPVAWPEPFGLVMIESMACGTPVIACPCGSVPEVILDGVSGYIVSGVSEAVSAVKKLDRIDRAGCRRHFERNFTDARMAENYLALYKQLIHPRSVSIKVGEEVLNWMEIESQTPSTT
jgi:glycosyltransferase involved in cell wall biosynthesis